MHSQPIQLHNPYMLRDASYSLPMKASVKLLSTCFAWIYFWDDTKVQQ